MADDLQEILQKAQNESKKKFNAAFFPLDIEVKTYTETDGIPRERNFIGFENPSESFVKLLQEIITGYNKNHKEDVFGERTPTNVLYDKENRFVAVDLDQMTSVLEAFDENKNQFKKLLDIGKADQQRQKERETSQAMLRETLGLPVKLSGSIVEISFPDKKSAEAVGEVLSGSNLMNNIIVNRSIENDEVFGRSPATIRFDIDEYNANKKKYPAREYNALHAELKTEIGSARAADNKKTLDEITDAQAKGNAIEQKYGKYETGLEKLFGLSPNQGGMKGSKFVIEVNKPFDGQEVDEITRVMANARNAIGFNKDQMKIDYGQRMGKSGGTEISIDLSKVDEKVLKELLRENSSYKKPDYGHLKSLMKRDMLNDTSSIEKPLAEALAGTNIPNEFQNSMNNYEPSGGKPKRRESQKGWAVS